MFLDTRFITNINLTANNIEYSFAGKGKKIGEIIYKWSMVFSDLITELYNPMKKEHPANVFFFLRKEVFHLQFEIA